MEIIDILYDFFGTSDTGMLALDLLVAAVLASALVLFTLELARIFFEYVRRKDEREEMQPSVKPAAAGPSKSVVETSKVDTRVDVLKATLPESMGALAKKYGISSVTLASLDGLAVASTSKTPDEDAAVYSAMYQSLFKVKAEQYYSVADKSVQLYSIGEGPSKVIGIARRPGAFLPEEVKGIQEDSRRVLEKFTAGKRK